MVGAFEMSELATNLGSTPAPKPNAKAYAPATSAAKPAETQMLITEQQVMLSTAAAVAVPPVKKGRLRAAMHVLTDALAVVFLRPEKRPARKHYPRRHVWLDNALMAREMHRL